MFKILDEQSIKKVVKPWGYELWMADETNSKYAFKKIFIKAPHQSSIQFHETKENKRLYGTNLKVKSPQILKKEEAPLVILKCGVYNNEIKNQIIKNINSKVIFL